MPRQIGNIPVVNAFIEKRIEIDEMIDRLRALSENHFDAHPDEIHWEHVGDLGCYAELLRQITDSAFHEGEHAPDRAPPLSCRAPPKCGASGNRSPG